jgi:uncharacterized protein YjdB
MKKKLLFLLPVLAILLGACNPAKDPENPSEPSEPSEPAQTVESVTLTPDSVTLGVDETAILTASVQPYTVDQEVTWTTADASVATVNDTGRVKAISAGTTTITATSAVDPTKKATCTVTVKARQVNVMVENPQVSKAYTGMLYQGTLKTWLYFNGELIDSNGMRINTSKNRDDAAPITLEDAGNNQFYFSFAKDGAKKYLNYVAPGGKKTYTYDDTPSTKWDWHSEACTLTTQIDGKMHYLGTYNTYETISGSIHPDYDMMSSSQYLLRLYEVMDAADPESITISPSTADIYLGASAQLNVKILPANYYTEETLTWSVAGNDKVTVSQEGLVSVAADAVIGSTATITAKLGTLTSTATITVKEKLNYGTLDNPLTVEELETVVNKLGLANNEPTPEEVYLRTVVSSNEFFNPQYGTYKKVFFTKADGSASKCYAYSTKGAEGVDLSAYTEADSLVGATLTFKGYGTIYNGTV